MTINNNEEENKPDTAVLYDVMRRHNAGRLAFGKRFHADGRVSDFALPPTQALPTSLWRMERSVPSDAQTEAPKIHLTAEDSPFYARSIAELSLFGQRCIGMHESLNMDRFKTRWMKMLMPVRMPRQFW